MAWGRLDDKLHSHPKLMAIPRDRLCEAMGLWALVNSWSNDHGTDGRVPRDIVGHFGTSHETAQILIDARMWTTQDDVYQVANWGEYNFTAAQVEAKKGAEAERKRKWREAKERKNRRSGEVDSDATDCPADVPRDIDGVPSSSALTHTQSHTHIKEHIDAEFDAWWMHYPRKKSRGQAEKAFRSARKIVDLETLTAAVIAYAKSVAGTEEKFIKYGATWLNGKCWLDEDLAPVTENDLNAWVKECYDQYDTKSIEDRTGFVFPQPDIPDSVTDVRQFNLDARREWIKANRERIVERIIAKES